MTIAKSAVAVIRHEQSFRPADTYFEGATRFVKLEQLWNRHRRFKNEVDLPGLYAQLSTASRKNGQPLFKFYPPINRNDDPVDFRNVWVACPSGN